MGDPPSYNSVKPVEQYNDIVLCLTNWGDDSILKDLPPNNLEVQKIKTFRSNNKKGYNYSCHIALQETQAPNGMPMVVLIHKKANGIVCHMLDIFDVINKAYCRMGHLRIEKTLANTKPMYYSIMYGLCKIFCDDCFVCHEKQPSIPARKGAKQPIILSHFHDGIQIDLIDMRTMRRCVVCNGG